VTVTHPEIIRYVMTIPEAARLVLQAAAIGESGQVLVLDTGESVKIVDLARDLIRLAGHTSEEIRIEFTGLRAGEKLYEELLADGDAAVPTRIARLRIARLSEQPRPPVQELLSWAEKTGDVDAAEAHARLAVVAAEYRSARGP
jgi:FlaA1/EpsC-like NDP-sugar epimerase